MDNPADEDVARTEDYARYASRVELREEVVWFALEMELALRRNDHKTGWSRDGFGQLWNRLREEADELRRATRSKNMRLIVREAADVANFAMMMADNAARAEEERRDG